MKIDRQTLKRYVHRLLLLVGLWWLLAGQDVGSWILGGPVILTLAAWRLESRGGPTSNFQVWRLSIFVPIFMWRSLLGSSDVAWRALQQRLPISPKIYHYPLRLPAKSPAAVFFANCLNLTPGTLTASWEGQSLRIHVLTEGPQAMAELRKLERQVALLFGQVWTGDWEDDAT
jgi:multisubunit Na+/H+ antiporter MnhE subunit